jgi:hypothetical protein
VTISVMITDENGVSVLFVEEEGFSRDDVYIPGHVHPSIIKALAAFQRVRWEKGAAANDV